MRAAPVQRHQAFGATLALDDAKGWTAGDGVEAQTDEFGNTHARGIGHFDQALQARGLVRVLGLGGRDQASTSSRDRIFGRVSPFLAAAILRLGSVANRFSATQKR